VLGWWKTRGFSCEWVWSGVGVSGVVVFFAFFSSFGLGGGGIDNAQVARKEKVSEWRVEGEEGVGYEEQGGMKDHILSECFRPSQRGRDLLRQFVHCSCWYCFLSSMYPPGCCCCLYASILSSPSLPLSCY